LTPRLYGKKLRANGVDERGRICTGKGGVFWCCMCNTGEIAGMDAPGRHGE